MKTTFLIAACVLSLVSCSNENLMVSQENHQTEAMTNFREALKNINKPENRPTSEEMKMPGFPEMSERRKDLLLPAAKGLIKSTGVNDYEMQKATDGDKSAIINWALDIYIDNTSSRTL
ncbi:hypothetical protein [Chryseobacterium gossypii]|uniref:hypothetical protein n=1 Tax=Chryseobacterium gossypii TaxID=3231602 RepID=UPI0035246CA3